MDSIRGMIRRRPLILLLTLFSVINQYYGEVWKEDVTSAMEIGLSTTGYERVDLRCDAEHFSVNVTLKNDFEGIVYTRGSHKKKTSPCFKRPDQNTIRGGDISIQLKIPFNKCLTVMDVAESCYTNTLVVQHDPELIMPGDAAFLLQCSFEPEFKVASNLTTSRSEPSFRSKVSLVSADPAAKTDLKENDFSVSSNTEKNKFAISGRVK